MNMKIFQIFLLLALLAFTLIIADRFGDARDEIDMRLELIELRMDQLENAPARYSVIKSETPSEWTMGMGNAFAELARDLANIQRGLRDYQVDENE